MLEKVRSCPTCGEPKTPYRTSWRCRPCLSAKALAAYHANPEPHRATGRAWRAANAERHAELQKVWRETNRDRIAAYNQQYYAANRESEIARALAYTKAHPEVDSAIKQRRNARKRAVICEHGHGCVTSAFLKKIRESRCSYCESPATQADHYRPLSRGGLHCRENIVPACQPCNASKNARDPEEWLRRRAG